MREKAAQMTQVDVNSLMNGGEREPERALNNASVAAIAKLGIGSIFNAPFGGPMADGRTGWTASEWRAVIAQIQAIYREHGAAPVLYGVDSIHGATYVRGATLFPQAIAAAATFSPGLMGAMAEVSAKETLAADIPWVFSPVLGIAVQPKWARVYETFGEDPVLAAAMGAAAIRGLQSSGKVAASMKHFIGYSNPTGGLDRADNKISDWDLANYFAKPFQAAADAGARTAMETYVSVNGAPVISSHALLSKLLRQDMSFSGLLVSDYGEVDRLVSEHHAVPTVQAAIELVLANTSLDMNMAPGDVGLFLDTVETLVQSGKIPESRLDVSVTRILKLKRDLGLLSVHQETATRDDDGAAVGSLEDQQLALQAARESVILLRNRDATLPIDAASTKRIFVTGPASNNIGYLCGGWSIFWQGSSNSSHFPHGSTIVDALRGSVGSHTIVDHLDVVDMDGQATPDDLKTGLAMANASDYTIVVLGEPNYAEKSGDIDDLALPVGQRQYLEQLTALSTMVVLVLVEGRPRLLKGAHARADAVLLSMLPCEQGGQAIADVVVGAITPSGKLPLTYPKLDALSLPYFHRVNVKCSPWVDCPVEWPFGFGLSYTTFKYSELKLSSTSVAATTGTLDVQVSVENTGGMQGEEVVLLYVSQRFRSAAVPETKLLKRFTRVSLAPGERKNVAFTLGPTEWSYVVPGGLQRQVEPGEFDLSVEWSVRGDGEAVTDAITAVFTVMVE